MTRINLVPVSELSDQHLIAEYRELPRVFSYAKTLKDFKPVKGSYRLGTGHVKFFVDKLHFLNDRYAALHAEMNNRGFKTSYSSKSFDISIPDVQKKYVPTQKEIQISRERINAKIALKPDWYRWSNK